MGLSLYYGVSIYSLLALYSCPWTLVEPLVLGQGTFEAAAFVPFPRLKRWSFPLVLQHIYIFTGPPTSHPPSLRSPPSRNSACATLPPRPPPSPKRRKEKSRHPATLAPKSCPVPIRRITRNIPPNQKPLLSSPPTAPRQTTSSHISNPKKILPLLDDQALSSGRAYHSDCLLAAARI